MNPEVIVFDPEAKTQTTTDKLSPEDEALLKDSEPFWLTDKFIERPCVAIMLSMLLLVLLTFLAVKLDYFALNE